MKKLVASLLFLFVACDGAFAQFANGVVHAVEFTATGGLTIVRDNGFGERLFRGSGGLTTYNLSPREYYSIGLGFSHRLSKKAELTLVGSIEQLGFLTKQETFGNPDTFGYEGVDQNRYFLMQLRFDHVIYRRWRVALAVGYSSFWTSKRTEFLLVNDSVTSINTIFTKDNRDFSRFDLNLALGVGYCIPIADLHNIKLFIQVRQGINDILNANGLIIRGFIPSIAVSYQKTLRKSYD